MFIANWNIYFKICAIYLETNALNISRGCNVVSRLNCSIEVTGKMMVSVSLTESSAATTTLNREKAFQNKQNKTTNY